MDCVHHSAPRDEDLLMLALDEDQSPSTMVEHLEECEICRNRLNRYRRLYHQLLIHLYRRRCPSGLQISYYCAGLLGPEEHRQIAAHLQECPLCAEEASLSQRFLAPPLLSPALTAPLQRLHALLVSLEAQPTLWLRQYRAGDLMLSLHLARSPEGEHILLGLLTGVNPAVGADAFAGGAVELVPIQESRVLLSAVQAPTAPVPGGQAALSATLDDRGQLVFKTVSPGVYRLILRLPGREVVIEDLAVDAVTVVDSARVIF
jgi:hypothetical protein